MRLRVAILLLAAMVVGVQAAPASAHPPAPSIAWLAPAVGPVTGGNLVTIHAHNIDMPLSVSVSVHPVAYRRISPTAIQIRMPAIGRPALALIHLRTRYGPSLNGLSSQYHYQWPPPIVTSLSTSLTSNNGGAHLIVRGRYFDGLKFVTFGRSNAVAPRLVNSSTIDLVIPSNGVGRVPVIVTTASGSSRATAASTLEYYPPAQVFDSSPFIGQVAGGDTVTLHGANFRAPATVLFGSTPASAVTVVSPSTLTAVAPPHPAGVVDITVTTPIGPAEEGAPYRYAPEHTVQWSDPSTIDTVSLTDVSCPSVDFCMAVDFHGGWVVRDASGWRTAMPGGGPGHAGDNSAGQRVSCTSATFCLSVDRQGGTAVWNGSVWSASTPLPLDPGASALRMFHVTCAAPSFCVVQSLTELWTWDGTAWTATPIARPSDNDIDSAVSCWAVGHCAVVDIGGHVIVLDDGTWSDHGLLAADLTDAGVIASVCMSATQCLGATSGQSVVAPGVIEPYVIDGSGPVLACGSTASCVLFADQPTINVPARVTTYDGTAWSTVSTAPMRVDALSCPAPSSCVAVSGTDVRTLAW